MPFLTAININKSYHVGTQRLHVLRDLSLTVERGEMVAIVGASGVGKSTLLHLLGGLDRMDTAAGSLVKTLLMELGRRQVYLRLGDCNTDSHSIGYEVVQGDRGQVALIARALGFKKVTDRLLEVNDA